MTDLLFIAPRARAIVSHAGRWRPRALAFGLIFALPALVLGLRVSVGPAQAQARAAEAAAARERAAIVGLVDAGRFAEARARLDQAAQQPGVDERERAALDFQRERMRRIRLDFGLDRAQAEQKVRAQIPDLKREEFDAWDRQGLLESMTIDGQVRYFNRAPSNLFRLSAQALARRRPDARPLGAGPMETLNAHHREVIEDAARRGGASAAPRRVRITQSLTVAADAVPAGKTLRAWLPYPLELKGQQEALKLLSSEPAAHRIAPGDAPQRTIYFERPARAGEPTRFQVSYELTVYARYRRIDPAGANKDYPVEEETRDHLGERPPHLVFTPALREFSRKVVGEEKDPYRIAQKLYAAVDAIPWAGAREYSTISNLSDYALRAGHADCGQQTLLLMALLRLNGIPSRWQSGWVFGDDGYTNMHDWGWLYLAPHGWLPMDVTTGRFDSPDPRLAGFYFGGIDAYRVAYNDDYGRPFVPAKRFERSDTVDSQRGEVEWEGGNLYFDQWDYDYNAQVLPTK